MPSITDPLPANVAAELARLRAGLSATIPPKHLDDNLLIATWNLRAFGGLTDAWDAPANASPSRDFRAVACIAEILSRFDVIAVQEVRDNLKALRHLMKLLGDSWAFTVTDVTQGDAGNSERMAFVFDLRRVRPSGLAGEIVLPPEWNKQHISDRAQITQFARTPYAVSFLSAGRDYKATFVLVTLHVIYGPKPEGRVGELAAIAEWLADQAKTVNSYDQNLIVLGDFNIDRAGDPNYEAFVSTGLHVPAELQSLPRTIFTKPGDTSHHFDQIAWFTGSNGVPALSLSYSGRAGNYSWLDQVLQEYTPLQQSWKISDHFPLWTEFRLRPSDDVPPKPAPPPAPPG